MPRRRADGLRYSKAAARELRAQLEHYAASAPGVDRHFAEAVRKAEALAIGNPGGFARVVAQAELRSIVVRRFPFKLFYVVRSDLVIVVSLAHTSRSDSVLLRRLAR